MPTAASVLAYEKHEAFVTFSLHTSIASSLVSAREPTNPTMTAPNIPVAAVGTKIARIASQRVAPIPKAASRSLGGTATSASREIAEMVGNTMMARTIEAGSNPGPLRSVPKIGIHHRCECNHCAGGRTNGITTKILDPAGQRVQPRVLRQPQNTQHTIKSGG